LPLENPSALREGVTINVSIENIYELDHTVLEMGYDAVRLPLYRHQHNPIELVWAQVIGEVITNVTLKMSDVEKLVDEALDAPDDNRRKCVTARGKKFLISFLSVTTI